MHVVLRRRERNVDMGLVHQTVEQKVVKGQRRGVLLLDGSKHGRLLHPVRADAIPVGPKGKKRRQVSCRSQDSTGSDHRLVGAEEWCSAPAETSPKEASSKRRGQ